MCGVYQCGWARLRRWGSGLEKLKFVTFFLHTEECHANGCVWCSAAFEAIGQLQSVKI